MMQLAPYWDRSSLERAIAANSPKDEPIELSLVRLERAIGKDGIGDMFSPSTLWYAYTKHPELREDYAQVMIKWSKRRAKSTFRKV